ncbi:MAG: serine hydrolase [Bacteroidales bacterium]
MFLTIFIACEKEVPNGHPNDDDSVETPPPLNWERNIYPQDGWSVAAPEKYGYRNDMGNEIESFIAANMTTTGLVVVVGGEIIYQYGNLTQLSYLASCRKSILAMLMGNYVENGTIELSLTVGQMGMDDVGGLLPIEKEASILNCITARSGVYHIASNTGDDRAYAPERGSQIPGQYYLYNNWDFNIAGTIFENLTAKNIYVAFEEEFAQPLGFQDFSLSAQKKGGTLSISQYPSYHFYLSTRDMARLGYLMLREGRWKESQILSKMWVSTITAPFTRVYEMNPDSRKIKSWGYGYMWWVWDGLASRGPYRGAYTAKGAGGQYITVLPALDMVIAHKTATNDNVHSNYYDLLKVIFKSQIEEAYFD